MMDNVRVPVKSRPMTIAEKYYTFLDLAWPTNPILSAELSVCPDADKVEARWRDFCAQRIYTRLMPTADLTIVDAGTARTDFATATVARADWAAHVAREAGAAYGLERVTGLRYLASPDEGGALIYLLGHHAIVDGRGGLTELQAFLQFLDERAVPTQDALSLPPAPRDGYAWQTDRRTMLELLREMTARNRDAGQPMPRAWPPATPDRRARLSPITLSAEVSSTLLDRARREGVRVFSAIAATWLHEVARTICSTDEGVLQLNVPVDRSKASDDPRRPAAMAVGVLGHRYQVRAGTRWELAREIAEALDTALDRGEGELFFHLARLDNINDPEKGAEVVGTAIRAAPPAVSVTNMGRIDASADPPWVVGMWGNLAATPNQVISFSTLGYRDRLCCTLWTDDVRVTPHQAADLSEGFIRALARGE